MAGSQHVMYLFMFQVKHDVWNKDRNDQISDPGSGAVTEMVSEQELDIPEMMRRYNDKLTNI